MLALCVCAQENYQWILQNDSPLRSSFYTKKRGNLENEIVVRTQFCSDGKG